MLFGSVFPVTWMDILVEVMVLVSLVDLTNHYFKLSLDTIKDSLHI